MTTFYAYLSGLFSFCGRFTIIQVLHIFLHSKIDSERSSEVDGSHFTTLYTSWSFYILDYIDFIERLVFNACSLCDYSSCRSLHENAFIHNGQQGLSVTVWVSHEKKRKTPIQLPIKYQCKRFRIIYVDSLVGLRWIPEKIREVDFVHTSEKWNLFRVCSCIIHNPHLVYYSICGNGV